MTDFTPIIPPDATPKLVRPWLVAAWPGMGGVGAIAATRLAQTLNAKPFAMIPERDFFPVEHVEVQHGIARTGRLPRSMFFLWRDPEGRRDLIIFIGEAQPPANGFALCQRIIELAAGQGVEQVVTFAAMATGLHPTGEPGVFGAVTSPALLATMRENGIELLQQGAITGLNGSLLAAANDRGIPGICLLGEMPFFAAAAPNPKSAKAALEAFERLAGVEFDLAQLGREAETMEPQLVRLLDQMERQAQLAASMTAGAESDEEEDEEDDEPTADPSAPDGPATADDPAQASGSGKDSGRRKRPSPAERRRIDELFVAADRDRTKAMALKAELDRLGLFPQYENRFLDLFRKGGS
ncbi:MAG TPA: PAC2 family protein [Phycisphaerales bacterium]|nr:PAC2 family protein [Phycisphaerales bacterium]HMP36394.1 PAC2 family protein [Phycisphaerales bacterium]